MASIFKPKGESRYRILYFDENGDRRQKTGYTDKQKSKLYADQLEDRARQLRDGTADRKAESFRDHERESLSSHLDDWHAHFAAKGFTAKQAAQSVGRVRRLVAVMFGAKPDDIDGKTMSRAQQEQAWETVAALVGKARLSDLTAERIQEAMATLRDSGRSLQTCNHYRAGARAFARWAWKNGRLRDNPLISLDGFNAKEDRRHDRRTVSLEELQQLIRVAERGPIFQNMTGLVRALCYRLAVATGLRYSEIGSILPGSFDWEASTVTVDAAYTKNGQTATLPLPDDLAQDLEAYVTSLPLGAPIFPLPAKGVEMLKPDLTAAGIPYEDESGLFFDFHSLRCQTATLADAAGVSPRVVQKMMRHSTLELTGRYTKPRAVDIEAAAGRLPSLKSEADEPDAMAMTGTDPGPVLLTASLDAGSENSDGCIPNGFKNVTPNHLRSTEPKVRGSNPLGCIESTAMKATKKKNLPDTYFVLVKRFPLTHIRDDDHLDAASAVIDRLLQQNLDYGAQEYLDALTDLVATYEDQHVLMPDASEADVLRELMRSNGLEQPELSKKVAIAQSTLAGVLSGNRSFTKEQVIKLAKFFHVAPAAFLPG